MQSLWDIKIIMPSAKKQRPKKSTINRTNQSYCPSENKAKRPVPLAASNVSYDADIEKRAPSLASSNPTYHTNPEGKCCIKGKNPKAINKCSEAYYANNKESMCANRRDRYALAEPKPDVKGMYLKDIQASLLDNYEARVRNAFKKQHETQ